MSKLPNITLFMRLSGVLILIFGALNACQKINPFEDLELTVNTDIYKAPVLIEFVDANPEVKGLPQNLKVTISGPGKDLVLNDAGKKNYTPSGNVLSLVLNKNVAPTTKAPIEFTVAVSGDGYVSTSKTIIITDPKDALNFRVPLTNIDTPPVGAATEKATVDLSKGKSVEVPSTPDKPETASITITPGTEVKDASGAIINSNEVAVTVVQYTTETQESIESFPGGFAAENVAMNSGSSVDGSFITGGFVAVEMEAAGKDVKSFSKPIEVTVGLNPDLKNPNTGELLKEGDSIPTWSYDSDTGAWKEEGVAKVIRNNRGELVAQFEAPHLSYWNLDWFYSSCRSWEPLTFNVSSNVTGHANSYDFYAKVYCISEAGVKNYVKTMYDFDVMNGNSSNGLYNANPPANFKLQVEVYSRQGDAFLGATSQFDPCSVSSVPITLNVTNLPSYLNVEVDFTAKCTNKKLNIKPSTWLYLMSLDSYTWNYSYAVSGKANFNITEGKTYYFFTYYDNKTYEGNVTFNKTSSVITANGKGITGTTSYNPVTDIVSVFATYESETCN